MSNLIIYPTDTIEDLLKDKRCERLFLDLIKNYTFDKSSIGEWGYRLCQSKKEISSKEAILLCEGEGWQAARLEHLILFWILRPQHLVALGSKFSFDNKCYIPSLIDVDYIARLGMDYFNDQWSSYYRFLSVCKLK